MKRIMLFVLLIIACASAYQDGWQSLRSDTGDSTVSRYVLHSDSNYVEVLYHIPGFFLETKTEGGETYYRINLKDEYSFTDSIGLPEIPILNDNIAIPICDSFKVTVNYCSDSIFTNFTVYPVPEIVYDSIGYHEKFVIVSSFYTGQDTLYPSYEFDTSSGYIRAQRLLHYELTPFRYNADDTTMTVYSEIHLRVDFYSPSNSICVDAGPMSNICRSTLLNSTHLPRLAAPIVMDDADSIKYDAFSTVSELLGDTCDYLIIVADTLWSNTWVDSIGLHRTTFNGFYVRAINYDSINIFYWDTLDNPYERMNLFIQRVYENCPAPSFSDNHLSFVLLLGDANDDYDAYNYLVPAYNMRFSDMYYGIVDGDEYPDYIADTYSVVIDTSMEDTIAIYRAETVRDSIVEELKRRRFWVAYANHGAYESFAYWQLNSMDVDSLNPGDVSLMFIESCHTSEFWHAIGYPPGSTFVCWFTDTLADTAYFRTITSYWFSAYSDTMYRNEIVSSSDSISERYEFWQTYGVDTFYDCLGEAWLSGENRGAIGYIGAVRENIGGTLSALSGHILHDTWTLGEIAVLAFSPSYASEHTYTLFGDPAYNIFSIGVVELLGRIREVSSGNSIEMVEISVCNISTEADTLTNVDALLKWRSFCGDTINSIINIDTLLPLSCYIDTFYQGGQYGLNVTLVIDPYDSIAEFSERNNTYRIDNLKYSFKISRSNIDMTNLKGIFPPIYLWGTDSFAIWEADSYFIIPAESLEHLPVRARTGGFAFASYDTGTPEVTLNRSNFPESCTLDVGWNIVGFETYDVPAHLYEPLLPYAYGWDAENKCYSFIGENDTLRAMRAYWIFSLKDTVLPLSCELFDEYGDIIILADEMFSLRMRDGDDTTSVSFGIDDSTSDALDRLYDISIPPESPDFNPDSDFAAWFEIDKPFPIHLSRVVDSYDKNRCKFSLRLCGPERWIIPDFDATAEDFLIYLRTEQGKIYDLKDVDSVYLVGKQMCEIDLINKNRISGCPFLFVSVDNCLLLDNNLLPQSDYPWGYEENQYDIVKMVDFPKPDGGYFNLRVQELGGTYDFFDHFLF